MRPIEKVLLKAIGKPVRRKEDERLVTGKGRFSDDFAFEGQTFAAMVRSPHPHARILAVHKEAALAMPGVLGVFTGSDCKADGLKPIPHSAVPSTKFDMKLTGPGGGPVFAGPVFPFCFITIACAAISGFHALVSSGTTPKLLERESHIRVVGYGAMVTEMCVGIMALIAACVLTPGIYFAINAPAGLIGTTAEKAAEVIRTWGFVLDPVQLKALAANVQEARGTGG